MRTLETLSQQEMKDLVTRILQKKEGRLDKDWSELCEEFGLDISPDTLRKAGVGIKLAEDANLLGTAPVATEAAGREYIERQKTRDLQAKARTIYREESRSELLRETIAEAVKGLPPMEVQHQPILHAGTESLVLTLGDFHYGAKINVVGPRGETINYFDHAVFENRMNKLASEVETILFQEGVEDIHIFLVGDLIDGMLRQSQLMRLEFGMVENTIRLSEYLAHWLNELSKHACLHVHAVTGNHAEVRPLKARNREFEEENLEKIIMWYLKSRLAGNENVEIDGECNRMSLVDVQGFQFLLVHGDDERRIGQIAADTIKLYGESIDFFVCGHLHNENEFPNGVTRNGDSVIIRVPSICGTDHYANSKGFGGYAGAIATIIEKDYGRRCIYPINLS